MQYKTYAVRSGTVQAAPADKDGVGGMMVQFPDGGGWLSIADFMDNYVSADTWQQRLLIEYEELAARHAGLTYFLNSEKYKEVSHEGQNQLCAQHSIMAAYASTLAIRIQTARDEGLFEGIELPEFEY